MDERTIKEVVNSIEMPKAMENRLKMNCYDDKRERTRPIHFKKWSSVATVFAILLLLLFNGPFTNHNSNSQFVHFTITAYAAESTGHQLLTEKTTFDFGVLNRFNGISSISGDGDNLIFTNISLQVSGDNIDFISYEINNGTFIEDVILTKEEVANKDQLVLEKINYITSEPNSEIYQAIKDIGNTFTIKYSEQQQTKYTLAIPHKNGAIEDDVKIFVTVTYTDGSSEQQTILVNQKSDSISLVLK